MTNVHFSDDLKAKMAKWVAKYPETQRQSAVLPILLLVQETHSGWLSRPLLDAVAEYLQMPAIAVYEVATFYSMFELEPTGKHVINVCTNISCLLSGSEALMAHLEKRLGIRCGQTTSDGQFTLREVECMAACTNAPMCEIGKQYYENLTPEKIDKILAGLSECK